MPYDLSSLMDLTKAIDFQFVHPFSWCENGSDDFQALYMLELTGRPFLSLLPSFLPLPRPPSFPSFFLSEADTAKC